LRNFLTSKTDFNLFSLVFEQNGYGESHAPAKNDLSKSEIIRNAGMIGLGGAAATSLAITGLALAYGTTLSFALAVGPIILLSGPVGIAIIGVLAVAVVWGSVVSYFTNNDKEFEPTLAKTFFTVARKQVKVNEKGIRDKHQKCIYITMNDHKKAIDAFEKTFMKNDSLEVGFYYGVPTRNDLFILTCEKIIVLYTKQQKLKLIKTRLKNYRNVLQEIRDIPDISESSQNFSTYGKIMGKTGDNLKFCIERFNELKKPSTYPFINNRHNIVNKYEINAIDNLFYQQKLYENNENIKIISLALKNNILDIIKDQTHKIIKVIINKSDRLSPDTMYEPLEFIIDLSLFPQLKETKSKLTDYAPGSSDFREYAKNNVYFNRYTDRFDKLELSYDIASLQYSDIIDETLIDNQGDILMRQVESYILEKYLKLLVGFNFDHIDLVDNIIGPDFKAENDFDKIISENNMNNDDSVSYLRKLILSSSTLFNTKNIEFETLSINDIIKTVHVLVDLEKDFRVVPPALANEQISKNTTASLFGSFSNSGSSSNNDPIISMNFNEAAFNSNLSTESSRSAADIDFDSQNVLNDYSFTVSYSLIQQSDLEKSFIGPPSL
jgi:hypothetical protein